jgi:hypothetical protein
MSINTEAKVFNKDIIEGIEKGRYNLFQKKEDGSFILVFNTIGRPYQDKLSYKFDKKGENPQKTEESICLNEFVQIYTRTPEEWA